METPMSADVFVESEEPGRIKVWAGNWLCIYTIENNRVVRREQSRYRHHPSARPDELIEQADKLAREKLTAQANKKGKKWQKSSCGRSAS